MVAVPVNKYEEEAAGCSSERRLGVADRPVIASAVDHGIILRLVIPAAAASLVNKEKPGVSLSLVPLEHSIHIQ